ncbi:MAG: alpha-glucosidase, partial [Candidatus Puniceispirillaceae bacterium]
WLPQGEGHFARAALEQAATAESVYQQFSAFLYWRKSQPAMMQANYMTALSGTDGQIIFDRVSDTQRLRCCFDFDHLDASFEEA